MKFDTIIIAGAIIAATSSAAFAKDTMAQCAKDADAWMAAYNAGDAQGLAAMYDPRKGTHSSALWTGTGHDLLVQSFKRELDQGSKMTSIKCETSNASGDFIVSTGSWSAIGKGPDGKDMTIGGHWQVSGLDQNGKYIIVNSTTNMQLPPPK